MVFRQPLKNRVFEFQPRIDNIIIEENIAAVFYRIHWIQNKRSRDTGLIPINKKVEFNFAGAHQIEFRDNKIIKMEGI